MAFIFLPNLKDKRWRRLRKLAAKLHVSEHLAWLVQMGTLGPRQATPEQQQQLREAEGSSPGPEDSPEGPGQSEQQQQQEEGAGHSLELQPFSTLQCSPESSQLGQQQQQQEGSPFLCIPAGGSSKDGGLPGGDGSEPTPEDHIIRNIPPYDSSVDASRLDGTAAAVAASAPVGTPAAARLHDPATTPSAAATPDYSLLHSDAPVSASAARTPDYALMQPIPQPNFDAPYCDSVTDHQVSGRKQQGPGQEGASGWQQQGLRQGASDDPSFISGGSAVADDPLLGAGLAAAYYLPPCAAAADGDNDAPQSMPSQQVSSMTRRRRRRGTGSSAGASMAAGEGGGESSSGGGVGEGGDGVAVQSCWTRRRPLWYAVNGVCVTYLLLALLAQPLYIYLSLFPRMSCSTT